MTQDYESPSARVVVEFHSSSTKGGTEAYKLSVAEGATEDEADRVLALALRLRAQAKKALETPPDLSPVLEASIEKVKAHNDEAPPVCERCGKRHTKDWIHPGDCQQCKSRPVIGKPGAVFCEECTAEISRRVDEALEKMK